jgi:hypothetical protein
MSQRLKHLSNWATSLCPLVLRQLEFGEIVAALIIAIALIPFASAGLWLAP